MKVMRMMCIVIVAMGLLFACTAMASAEVLFGVGADVGRMDLTADYDQSNSLVSGCSDISATPTITSVNGELNLLMMRLYLDYGQANTNKLDYCSLGVRAGWELGLDILRLQLLAGVQTYGFKDKSQEQLGNNAFGSLVGGLGVESEIGKLKIYGSVLIPVLTRYSNVVVKDNSSTMSYLNAGLSYSMIRGVALYANYRKTTAESDVIKLDSSVISAGARLSF